MTDYITDINNLLKILSKRCELDELQDYYIIQIINCIYGKMEEIEEMEEIEIEIKNTEEINTTILESYIEDCKNNIANYNGLIYQSKSKKEIYEKNYISGMEILLKNFKKINKK